MKTTRNGQRRRDGDFEPPQNNRGEGKFYDEGISGTNFEPPGNGMMMTVSLTESKALFEPPCMEVNMPFSSFYLGDLSHPWSGACLVIVKSLRGVLLATRGRCVRDVGL